VTARYGFEELRDPRARNTLHAIEQHVDQLGAALAAVGQGNALEAAAQTAESARGLRIAAEAMEAIARKALRRASA
jgi:hypothetical protein